MTVSMPKSLTLTYDCVSIQRSFTLTYNCVSILRSLTLTYDCVIRVGDPHIWLCVYPGVFDPHI